MQFHPNALLHPKLYLAIRSHPTLWRHQGEGEAELDDFCTMTYSMGCISRAQICKIS